MKRTVVCEVIEKENNSIICTLRCTKTNESIRICPKEISYNAFFYFYGWIEDDIKYELKNPVENKI